MMKKHKYEPEDIEKLLRNKPFESLLEEEREFILNHLDSEYEYQNMRSLLLKVENNNWDDFPGMDHSLRNNLLKKHKDHHKKSMRVWLNTFFGYGSDKFIWYKAPGFQLAFASVLLFGIIFTFQNVVKPDNSLADANIENAENIPPKIVEDRALDEKGNQTVKLKKLDLSESETEMSNKIDNSYAEENKTDDGTFTNSNISVNSNENTKAEPVMDISLVAEDVNKSRQIEKIETINDRVENDQVGYVNTEDVIDTVQLQITNNTSLLNNKDKEINVYADDVAELEKNSHSNYGKLEQAKESMTDIEIPTEELPEISIASIRRSSAQIKSEEIENKTIPESGITLNENPEIINQLFTSY